MLYVGKWTPYRHRLVEALSRHCELRVHIDAGENRFSVPVHPPLTHPEALARAYSAASLALETARVELPGAPFDGSHRITNRPQSAAARGTPSLCEPFAHLPLFFEPGREIAIYRNAEELARVARHLLDDPSHRRRMGRLARRRLLRHHTWRLRARKILDEALRVRGS